MKLDDMEHKAKNIQTDPFYNSECSTCYELSSIVQGYGNLAVEQQKKLREMRDMLPEILEFIELAGGLDDDWPSPEVVNLYNKIKQWRE